jgi:hypothetical protein
MIVSPTSARSFQAFQAKEDNGLDDAIARAILGQLETLQRIDIAERDRLLAEVGL